MTKALDSAFPGWTIAELKTAGIVAVFRYVAPLPNGKVITKAEYDGYLVAGIGIGLVWESSGTSFTGGYAAGMHEGHEARRQALALGHPDERPVFAAYDTGATQSSVIHEYQRGFNDGGSCGPQGVYGDVVIGEYLLGLGLARFFWETNARGWPGDAIDDPRACMVQRYVEVVPGISGSYDVDDVFAVDFGQNPRPVVKPTPPMQSPPIDIGDNVQLTTISGIHLDANGNGEIAVAGIAESRIAAVVIVGGSDPLVVKRYDATPVARVVPGSSPALIVLEGGVPSGTYTVRCAHS